jgi:hypothetical protein
MDIFLSGSWIRFALIAITECQRFSEVGTDNLLKDLGYKIPKCVHIGMH